MKKSAVKLWIGIGLFVLISIITVINPLQVVQWKITDLFFRGRGASDAITIIAIDNKSLSREAKLGRFKDWPRSYYAQLLRALAAAKPAVVAFDLDFREVSRGMSEFRVQQLLSDAERQSGGFNWAGQIDKFAPAGESGVLKHPDDVDFQQAIDESPFPVALHSTLQFEKELEDWSKGFPKVEGNIAPVFGGPNAAIGYNNIFRDRDGVLRRFMPRASSQPSFPLAIASKFTKRMMPEETASQILIDYAAPPLRYRTLSFVDVIRGEFQPNDVAGKIVLVGGTAPILKDFQVTPTSRMQMSGVEVVANMAQQLAEGRDRNEQGSISLIALLALITLGGSYIFFRAEPKQLGFIFGIIFLALPAAAFGLYQTGRVMNVVYPEFAWIFTAIAALWYRNQSEFREKRMLKTAFSHYVSPVVVDDLVKNPSTLKLGGKRETISVMFSDIVGFTTLAEKLTPEDTVALLNDYLTAMTEIIFEYHGTLDKYQGDAIMALFGAPVPDEHRAVNACHTGLAMRKALVALHEKWNAIPSLPFKDELIRLDFRVGIATGPAVIGNVGSEKRFDYTAIGDIVNLGSRLESVNRKYGTHVIVDKATFITVTENHNPFVFRKLDQVRVKGKTAVSEIFEVVGLAETATTDLKTMLEDFENGRILYMQRSFVEAKQHFEAVLAKFPTDGPAQIYRNRCNYFLRKPPSRDWDGVVNLEEK